MSIAEFINDPKAESAASETAESDIKKALQPADEQKKQRREMIVVFATVVAIGLTMAGTYVAYRIATGSNQATPLQSASTVPQPVAVVRPAAAPPTVVAVPQAASKPVESKPVEPKSTTQPVESKPTDQPMKQTTQTTQSVGSKPARQPVVAAPSKTVASSTPTVAIAKPAATVTIPKTPPTKPAPKPAMQTPSPKPVATPAQQKQIVTSAPTKAAVDKPVKVRLEKPAGEFRRRDVNPHHGEKYWQIAAYGQRCLDDYLKVLSARGFQPLVAPGPSENIFRVFVGPFPDSAALEQAHRSIQSMGIEPILRSY